MSKFAKQHHPFDKGSGHDTNILLIVILCISSLIVICANCTYLLQLKSMRLWQKVTHIRAVYTRENKPRITQSKADVSTKSSFAAYVSRERAFCTNRVHINGSVRGLSKPRIV